MDSIKVAFIRRIAHSLVISNVCADVAAYIGCQFALESNFGDSSLARNRQNYCGMKFPSIRPTLAYGSYDDFACYMSLEDCVIDYCLWLSYKRPPKGTLECFDSFRSWLANSSYCPEPTYISRIDAVYCDYTNSLNSLL